MRVGRGRCYSYSIELKFGMHTIFNAKTNCVKFGWYGLSSSPVRSESKDRIGGIRFLWIRFKVFCESYSYEI